MFLLVVYILLGIQVGLVEKTVAPQDHESAGDYTSAYERVVLEFAGKKNAYLNSISVTLNPVQGHLYFFENEIGVLHKLDPTGNLTVLDTLEFPESNEYHFVESRRNGQALLFWEVGLGEVYEYEISSGLLRHLSDTDVNKLMYSHGAVLDTQGDLLSWGGYGFWEMRKLLLTYSMEKNEWLLGSDGFHDYQEYSYFHDIWYDSSQAKLDYLFNLLMENGDIRYNAGSYDIEGDRWESKRWFSVDKQGADHRRSRPLFIQNSYLSDYNSGIHYLSNAQFYSSSTYEIFRLDPEMFPNLRFLAGFYLAKDNEWLLIGKDVDNSTTNLKVIRLPNEELKLSPIPSLSYPWVHARSYWWVGLLLVITIVSIGVFIYRRNRFIGQKNDRTKVELEQNAQGVQVRFNGESVSITDDYVQRSWALIYRLKQKGQGLIRINDFDEEVFFDNHSGPFRSRKRKAVLKAVNRHIEEPILRVVINSIDKRYKDIELDLTLVTIS